MITDPLALGEGSDITDFSVTETGPGARTIRPETGPLTYAAASVTYGGMQLTISHEKNKSATRRRSLIRLEFKEVNVSSTGASADFQPPFVNLVIDRPVADHGGDVAYGAKVLLTRILGLLAENAYDSNKFESNTLVEAILRGEP